MNRKLIAILGLATLACSGFSQNLLRNAGFEDVPSNAIGQGLLPSDWYTISPSPDTYSNDGSYGLSPTTNFNGIAANGGIRFVAGWALVPEIINQNLTSTLTAGATYTVGGFLHQAFRADLDIPGGYDVVLYQNASTSSGVTVAHLGDTSTFADGWNSYSASFVAPTDAATRGIIGFVPVGTNGVFYAYPGLDDVRLTAAAVPEPATLSMLAFTLAAACLVVRRKS